MAQPVTTISGEILLNGGWSSRHMTGFVSGVSGGISGNLINSKQQRNNTIHALKGHMVKSSVSISDIAVLFAITEQVSII